MSQNNSLITLKKNSATLSSRTLIAFMALLLTFSAAFAPALAASKANARRTVIADPPSALHPGRTTTTPSGKPVITDPTTQVVLAPGLVVTFHVFDGLDTQWRLVGNYDFVARIEEAGKDGFIYEWQMGEPASASGSRRVEPGDVHQSRKVSLFYPKHETTTLVGYTNAIRISDALFKDLKAGKRSEFAIDGPEAVMVLHQESVPMPHYIKGEGEETVNMRIENQDVPVRCLKAVCDNGWTYWVLDNPRFPLLVQGNAPFRWVTSLVNAYGETDARKEAENIFDQLKDGGVATSYLILFDFDSAQLRDSSKGILRSLSHYIINEPNLKLQVEGHTCTIGSHSYNMSLSQRRAESVRRYLIESCGISPARLKAVGFGFTRPEKPNNSEANRARNRRVIFRQFN
jgi:outer membrane protein OmpA-like peptidoglycan-associated protein